MDTMNERKGEKMEGEKERERDFVQFLVSVATPNRQQKAYIIRLALLQIKTKTIFKKYLNFHFVETYKRECFCRPELNAGVKRGLIVNLV